jgi:hypothetical protein
MGVRKGMMGGGQLMDSSIARRCLGWEFAVGEG